MIAIAWDVETCPFPEDSFSAPHQERFEKELAKQQDRNPNMGREEVSQRARSFHPYLGWITCISVVRGKVGGEMGTPYSWSASAPDEEEAMLREFWGDIEGAKGHPRWATYNGKDFDVPFLTARSSFHGVSPTRSDMIDTYLYKHRPHADLSKVWLSVSSSLEEMCAHLGVPSPKDGMDGSGVAEAVSEGRMGEVEDYCEQDAIATFRCLTALQWAL
jgi:predicted PolB exonuclease-like 3'-5' exonuclease